MTTLLAPADVVRETFNFSVDKFPLSFDGHKTPYYGLFRSDNNECLNSVTDRYYAHTTDDVVALVEAAQEAFDGDCSVNCWWNKGHHVIVQPTREYRKAIFGTRDNVFPRMMINAGYNDTTVAGSLGMWRDACDNLSIPRSISAATTSIRHTASLRPRMNELIAVFSQLRDSWKSVTEVVAQMQDREVNLNTFLAEVYPTPEPDSKRAVTNHRDTITEIFRRLSDERFRTGRPSLTAVNGWKVSAFEAYQSVQGYVQHVQYKNKNENDRILSAASSKSVLLAEQLAVSA